jgi:hypothetical protein
MVNIEVDCHICGNPLYKDMGGWSVDGDMLYVTFFPCFVCGCDVFPMDEDECEEDEYC